MKPIVADKPLTLIAAGCSHTQGCAFVKKRKHGNKVVWASQALKDKYKVKPDFSFITENLTYMGKLKKFLPIDKIVNFGYGGQGTDSTLRAINNYLIKTDSLTNHLFIIQLQEVWRNEIVYTFNKKTRMWTVKHFALINDEKEYSKLKKEFLTYLFHVKFEFAKYLRQLLYLQNIIEKSGGQVRIFFQPFYKPINYTFSEKKLIENLYYDYLTQGFEKKLQKLHTLDELSNTLNIIENYSIGDDLMKYGTRPTLHNEGLLDNDHHLSEIGNEILAENLYKNINNKLTKSIFGEKALT